MRKLHDNISDPKYDGVKVSRKQLLEDESPEEEEGEDDDESEEEEASPHQSDRESDEANGGGTEIVAQTNEHSNITDIAITLRKTHDEDRKKGLAVSRQLVCLFKL